MVIELNILRCFFFQFQIILAYWCTYTSLDIAGSMVMTNVIFKRIFICNLWESLKNFQNQVDHLEDIEKILYNFICMLHDVKKVCTPLFHLVNDVIYYSGKCLMSKCFAYASKLFSVREK